MNIVFIKKNLVNILLFFGVFIVFSLTGTTNKKQGNSSLKIDALLVQDIAPLPLQNENNSQETPIANFRQKNLAVPLSVQDSKRPLPNTDTSTPPTPQSANPYAILMNRGNQNQGNSDIKNSLSNLKGQAPSTEALIERNTYFKKLSEQLKDLQGNVSTDEEKPKENTAAQDQAADLNANPENALEELSDQELEEELSAFE